MDFASWAKAAGVRALRTFAQTAIAVVGLGEPTTGILDVSWLGVVSIASLATLLSLLHSVAGLPEVTNTDTSEQASTE